MAEEIAVPTAFPWLKNARTAWYPFALLAFGIWVAAVPGFIIIGTGGVADPRFSPNPSLIIDIITWSAIIIAISVSLGSLFLSLLLFRRRSDDGMALLTSFFLLGYGVIITGPLEALEPFLPGIATFSNSYLIPLFQPLVLLLFAVFPDGRFVPRWIRWIVLTAVLTTPLSLFWTTRFGEPSLDYSDPWVTLLVSLSVLVAVATWGSTIYAQIYRYRRVSNIQQKQQAKWILYGLGLLFTTQVITSFPWIYSYSLPPGTPYPIWLAASTPIWLVSIAVIPLALTIAVMRYRLFEIDFIINRSLMYGALTIVIVVIYILVVGSLGTFFQVQGNLIIALLATGIVAVLFQPLRERLQRGVNRLIYGERDDPVEALSRLGKQLESAVPPVELLPTLVETIAHTLKLPYVSIQLPPVTEEKIAASYGKPTADLVRLPLVFQGEDAGQLVVGQHGPGNDFSPMEMRLLRNIARQAGIAVHAVRLTDDLLRSRHQLITAREEERRRLRRDLHDGLGATLAALNLEAAVLRHSIRPDPEKAEALVDEFRRDIRAAIEDIRRLVYQLRPPTLDQLGLVEAVRTQADRCGRSGEQDDLRLHVRVEAPEGLPPLPAAVEVAAFRIVQEALTNVVTHARARHCVVRLEMGDDLCVEIVDDGVGMANGQQPNAGLGLLTMRERAEELGGVCLIESAAEGGTRVSVSLPLLEA